MIEEPDGRLDHLPDHFAAINPVSASGAEQVTSAFPVRALGTLN